jgi:signal recognition particle receptor subunit beta
MVLKGVDGIVFVADSQKEMANENLENLKNLAENLRSIGKELSKIPLVIQFNKRDLPNILSVEEMNRLLNAPGLPFFEAVAVKGEGVLTTLTRITRVVADHLQQTLFAGSGAATQTARPQSAP